MSVWEESGIRFDFSGAAHSEKHDAENRAFPAVDFLVHETPGNWLYVEVKNWEPASLPAHAQAESRADFAAKMQSAVFYQELRNKFLGTSAFLTLMKKPQPTQRVLFVVVLESPILTSEFLSHAITRMRGQLPNRPNKGMEWAVSFDVAVVSVAEWNKRFTNYPATVI